MIVSRSVNLKCVEAGSRSVVPAFPPGGGPTRERSPRCIEVRPDARLPSRGGFGDVESADAEVRFRVLAGTFGDR